MRRTAAIATLTLALLTGATPAHASTIVWTDTLNQCWYVVGGHILDGYEGKYDRFGVWHWACYRA